METTHKKKAIAEPQFGGEEGCITCGGTDLVMITMFRKQTLLESNLSFFKCTLVPLEITFYYSTHQFIHSTKPLFEYPQ